MNTRKELLSEGQWEKIAPFIPRPKRSKKGGPNFLPSRRCFEGILWILWTGAPWKALPQEYPSPSTCWRRLKKWEDDGTWLKIWRAFIAELDEAGQIDWSECFMDATFAPAKKGGLASEKPKRAKEQSLWWWQTARVFLWETKFSLPLHTKANWPLKRSKR